MAERRASVTIYECDAPDCSATVVRERGGDQPPGLAGTATEVTADGGSGSRWFACSRAHVGPAVAAALDRRWQA